MKDSTKKKGDSVSMIKDSWLKGEERKRVVTRREQNWILVIHEKPHPADYVSLWEMMRLGGEKFPGVEQAEIFFTQSGEKSGMAFESTNVISIDTGGGRYDEHRNGGETDRLAGECSATLIAKDLGIREKPEVKELLDYVFIHDSSSQRRNFDFADLVTALNHSEMEQKEITSYVFDILDALYELKREPTQKYRNALTEIIEIWIRKSRIPAEISKPVTKFVNQLKNGGHFDFDLTTIYKALFQKFGLEKAQKKIEIFLDAKYERQISFFEAVQEIRNLEITKTLTVRRENQNFVVVVGESDNREYGKAARFVYKNTAIVIQRKKSGRTFVFGNNNAPIKDEMSKIMAMIRLEEMLLRGQMPILDYRKMSSAGTLDEIPYWHLLRGPDSVGLILNGSDETAPDIKPTVIPLDTIVKFVTMTLKLGSKLNWRQHIENAMRIHARTRTMNTSTTKAQTAEGATT